MGFAQLVRDAGAGVLFPAIVAGILWVLATWRRSGEEAGPRTVRVGGAVAFGAAYLVGHVIVAGFPSFPPAEALHWLAAIGVFAAVAGVGETFWRGPEWARQIARLVVSAASVAILTRPLLAHGSAARGALEVVGLAAGTLAFWGGLDALAGRTSGLVTSLVFLVVATGESVLLIVSHSAVLARLAGVLAAALGASAVVGWRRSALTLERGAVAVVALVLAGLAVDALFFLEDTPPLAVALLAVSPAGALVGEIPRFKRGPAWRVALARIVPVAVLAAGACAVAFAMVPAASPDGY